MGDQDLTTNSGAQDLQEDSTVAAEAIKKSLNTSFLAERKCTRNWNSVKAGLLIQIFVCPLNK